MPAVASSGIASIPAAGPIPYTTTVTAPPGANRLLVVFIAYLMGSAALDPATVVYNGVTLTDRVWNGVIVTDDPAINSFDNHVLWTTSVADSATLSVDTTPISGKVVVAWATFTGAHQSSPVIWIPTSSGFPSGTHFGIGPGSGDTLNGVVPVSSLIYGFVNTAHDNAITNTVDAPGTDLDSMVTIAGYGSIPGEQCNHAYRFGDDTDTWNLTWHKVGAVTGAYYAATAVAIRDVGDTLPTAAASYAWGRIHTAFGIVQDLPVGDSLNYNAQPRAIGIDLTGAATCTTSSAVGIGIGKDGFPYTWGDDTYGLRGDGTTGVRLVSPFQLAGYPGCTDIAAGTGTLFWFAGGVLYGLGLNGSGEFADGTTTASATPVTIAPPGGATIVQIAAGNGFLLARDDAGRIWHVGAAGSGQRGDGSTATSHYTAWGQVGVGASYVGLSAGDSHALGLKGDGTVDSWGLDSNGQCGRTTTAGVRAVGAASGVTAAVGIVAFTNSSAALTTVPSIFTWGQNNVTQLGRVTGTLADQATPTGIALGGSTPKALMSRACSGQTLLWTGTDRSLWAVGNNTSYPIDPIQAPLPIGSQVNFADRVLGDRIGAVFDWATSSAHFIAAGIIAGGAPLLPRTFVWITP